MEPVAILGLASNVLQFFEFTTKLIRIANELRHDAASSENRDHLVIATHLEELTQHIQNSAHTISQASAVASAEERALQPIINNCCGLAKDLLERLNKCGIRPGQNANQYRRAKEAFKTIWNKKEIGEIANRLQLLRSEINLHDTVQIKKVQFDQQRANIEGFQAVQRKIDSLGPQIDGLKRDIDEATSKRGSEIINSILESRTENSQAHAREAQKALSNHTVLSKKLDNLQSSMDTMDISLKSIRSQQSESFEPMAQVSVRNSVFFAETTQQTALDDVSGASFQNVIRPLLEEYMEKVLLEMKKEYRASARSEADHLLQGLSPTLHEAQSRIMASREIDVSVVSEDKTETCWESSESHNYARNDETPASSQRAKENVSTIYRSAWWKQTSFGHFMLVVYDQVHFDRYGWATRLYNLSVQFIPPLRWLATSSSITYESRSDARGSLGFGLKYKTYRVLENDHDVFDVLMNGDVSILQNMLSRKLVSPSDISEFGWPLLHCAVLIGRVINDFCHWAWLPIESRELIFDTLLDERIGCDASADIMDIIPVAFAADCMVYHFQEWFHVAENENNGAQYRGHHVNPVEAECLRFLEYIISRGIKERPDCVFDSYDDLTVSQILFYSPLKNVWEEILQEHGFDVYWVYKEHNRRLHTGTGETSAHEVNVRTDASALKDVRRRRGYENTSE
ncbi:hypothetical protein GGR52DRAFT_573605 [Hypoxylon sp. FL1284]|nr:hypothetical protein GGR52DRAFT_573605 [Hypoxylon sp. FL1284]